jgi:hypothetical protein
MSEIVDTMRYAAMSNHQRVTLQGGDAKYAMAWTVAPISDRKYHSIGHDQVKANTVRWLCRVDVGFLLLCWLSSLSSFSFSFSFYSDSINILIYFSSSF